MTDKQPIYTNISISKLEGSLIEISANISAEHFDNFRSKALKKLGESTKLDGFRPGHIPEKILTDRLGEGIILEEAAEIALSEAYPVIVQNENLQVIGRPQITLTKLAKDNPLGFKIKTAIVPPITLPDYKTVAKEILLIEEKVEVTDKEIDAVIIDIQKTRAAAGKKQKIEGAVGKIDEKNLPPLTDASVKDFGDFKNIEEFRKRLRENMLKEKEMKAREKKRVAMSEELIKKTTVELPKILVESELDKMNAQLKADIKRRDMEYEDYLKQINKTEKQLRTEWEGAAVKRATLQLILNKIAEEENITPDEYIVEEQVKHIMERHKDAKQENIHIYVETLMINEMVFGVLEKQKK